VLAQVGRCQRGRERERLNREHANKLYLKMQINRQTRQFTRLIKKARFEIVKQWQINEEKIADLIAPITTIRPKQSPKHHARPTFM